MKITDKIQKLLTLKSTSGFEGQLSEKLYWNRDLGALIAEVLWGLLRTVFNIHMSAALGDFYCAVKLI